MTPMTLCECFARDGLQHEPVFVPTHEKVGLIDAFTRAGFTRIETTSYSHPGQVPAFADASEVLERAPRRPGVRLKATCPNLRAVQRACADRAAGRGADELSFLVSATETHSEQNLRATREQQWRRVAEMTERAGSAFLLVGVISVAFGCPFEGTVDPGNVLEDVARFAALGITLVTIGDTIGLATPRSVTSLFTRIRAEHPTVTPIGHFHDTRGAGIANCVAALEADCHHLDSAFGGVGGHPAGIRYGGGETGNVCTEDLAFLLDAMGASTGLDLDEVMRASRACERVLGRPLGSKIARLASAAEKVAHVGVH